MLADPDLLSIQEVRTKVEAAWQAQQKYRTYSQEQVDTVVERMAAAARAQARQLAEMAVEETGYGNAKDKYIKNLLTCDWLPRRMRGMKTVGILRELPDEKLVEIGVPVGVVAAVLPTTNPTSTAIYKTLISLKGGNAVVVSPHPRARKCTCATVSVLYQAAVEAGAPEGIIQCVDQATIEGTNALMRHEKTERHPGHSGGSGHREGRLFQRQARLRRGPRQCSGAGGHVGGPERCRGQNCGREEFRFRHGLFQRTGAGGGTPAARPDSRPAERAQGVQSPPTRRRRRSANCWSRPNLTINPQCVGQAPTKLARMAGFEVPPDTSIICCEVAGVGKQFPLSMEKLSPVLSLHFVSDYNTALDTCFALLKFGGLGHTAVVHAKNDARIREYGLRMPAMRVLVNTPAPQGSTGITTNLFPAMTLGCGAAAGNITSDNLGPQHLINVKRLAYVVRKPEEAFEMPLDINQAPAGAATAPGGAVPIDRNTVIAAVEKYLASRGFAVPASTGASAPAPRRADPARCETKKAVAAGRRGRRRPVPWRRERKRAFGGI